MANLVAGDNILNIGLIPLPPPTANLFGTVTDAQTGAPLSGVLVDFGGITSTLTDTGGNYSFTGLPTGNFTITFSKTGYQTLVM